MIYNIFYKNVSISAPIAIFELLFVKQEYLLYFLGYLCIDYVYMYRFSECVCTK
jgi:hypothetical protein